MKFFVVFCVIAATFVAASPTSKNQEAESSDAEANNSAQSAELTRLRKAASYGGASAAAPSYSAGAAPSYGGSAGGYGGASIPAPPCPKNYLFSCQPNLAPVPCAAPSASYGGAGAYSAPVPTYMAPYNNFQGYVPQAYGYQNQFYQY